MAVAASRLDKAAAGKRTQMLIDGAWVEGQESGETSFDADGQEAVIEDETTVHWFYNRGAEPATAIVCDIRPAG